MVMEQEGKGTVKQQRRVIIKAWKGPDCDVKDIPKRMMLCEGGSGQKVSDNREAKSRWGTGRVLCWGSHSWSVEGARIQVQNEEGALGLRERGPWLWKEKRNKTGKSSEGKGG